MPLPGDASYTASKAMVSSFMNALHFELRDRIDATVWEPGLCQTNIFEEGEKPPNLLTTSSRKAVSDALCHVGKSR